MRYSLAVLVLLACPVFGKPRLPEIHVSAEPEQLKTLLPQTPPVLALRPRPGNEPPERHVSQPWPNRWFFYGAGWSPIYPSDPRLPVVNDPYWWGTPMLTPGDVPYRL